MLQLSLLTGAITQEKVAENYLKANLFFGFDAETWYNL